MRETATSDAHGIMRIGGKVLVYGLFGKDGCNGRYAHASGMYAAHRLRLELSENAKLVLTGKISDGCRVCAGHAIQMKDQSVCICLITTPYVPIRFLLDLANDRIGTLLSNKTLHDLD